MNVNVDAKNLGDTIKSIPYKAIMCILTLICALLIFLPDVALEKMFLLDFRNKIDSFLGVLFIVLFCLTAYLLIMPKIRDNHIKKELSGEKAKNKIENLSNAEKRIIVYMYRHQAQSIVLPGTCSAVIHLKSLLMISEASSIGSQFGNIQLFPFFLQQWVIKALEMNSDLMKGIPDKLPEEIEQYMEYF